MKKFHFTSALFALALIITAAPMQAQKQESNTQKAINLAKNKVSESIDRLKRCIKGDCSRMEALKAARDVTFAVIAFYAAGYATRKARVKAIKLLPFPEAQRAAYTVTSPISWAEEAAMFPGEKMKEAAGYAAKAVKYPVKKLKEYLTTPKKGGYYLDRNRRKVYTIIDVQKESGEIYVTIQAIRTETDRDQYVPFDGDKTTIPLSKWNTRDVLKVELPSPFKFK